MPEELAATFALTTGSTADLIGDQAPLGASFPVTTAKTANLGMLSTLEGWTLDESQKSRITIDMYADLELLVPLAPPPATLQNVNTRRISRTYPAPALDDMGRPINWTHSSEVGSEWGRLRVSVNDVDVSYFRDVPTTVQQWSSTEPGDDSVAVVLFSQISPYEVLGAGDLWWLVDFAPVVIRRVFPDGSLGDVVWGGLLGSLEDHLEATSEGTELQCVGTLYQLDWYKNPPPFTDQVDDIGRIIARTIDHKRWYGFRGGPAVWTDTGIQTRVTGGWENLLTGYFWELLAKAVEADGDQWTLMKWPNSDRPEVRLKDRSTVHWRMYFGQPGLTCQLSRDPTAAPNAYYGEGIDLENCHWRNSKYPNLAQSSPVAWPGGSNMSVGFTGSKWQDFAREGIKNGYAFGDDNNYASAENKIVKDFQRRAGILVDGIVGAQTWTAMFEVGLNSGDLSGAYYAPLAVDTTIEPNLYSGSGAEVGRNPAWNSQKPRIEHYINYGSRVTKQEGLDAAATSLARDGVIGYHGQITLHADPQEGSRFEIHAGQNFQLRGHRGVDRLLHIAGVTVNWQDQSVTLTVDEQARDLMTIAAIRQRDRETNEPTRRLTPPRRSSKVVEDKISVWDCEAGAGIFYRRGVHRNLWTVVRLPFGQRGSIVRTDFQVEIASAFAVAVFGKPITDYDLRRLVPNPYAHDAWEDFPEDGGLLIAWGGESQAGGYWPGDESDPDDPVTGRLRDDAGWQYESEVIPWVWVAVYVNAGDGAGNNFIKGAGPGYRAFYPGIEG